MSALDEHRVELQTGWQGGPAWVDLGVDEVKLDDGSVAAGVLLKVHTPCDATEPEFELGTGRLKLRGPLELEFWLLASIEQAAQLRDRLQAIVDELEAGV